MSAPEACRCTSCASSTTQISTLISSNTTLTAQRDHYNQRCDELTCELATAKSALNARFSLSDYAPDPAVFARESLERLRQWRECLDCCIEEQQDKAGEEEKRGKEVGIGEEAHVLPFGKGGLGWAGLLTRNHRLTQRDGDMDTYLERRKKGEVKKEMEKETGTQKSEGEKDAVMETEKADGT